MLTHALAHTHTHTLQFISLIVYRRISESSSDYLRLRCYVLKATPQGAVTAPET